MKTQEQKIAAKALKKAKKAEKFARDNRVAGPEVKFAPACSITEFFAPLPNSAAAIRAKINR